MRCWLYFVIMLVLVTACAQAEKRIVCYWGSWSVYRPGDGIFAVEDIDPNLCTHLVYTFVGINTDGEVVLLDSWNDIDEGSIKNFNALRDKNPSLKTMVAIGGWNEGSEKYSQVVNNDATRAKFVDNVVNFVKKYEFDGFDIDWEYPTQRGGQASDKTAFSKLLSELRPKFDENGFVLSAAVSAGVENIDAAYEVPQLAKYLDWINVMTYDLHGDWDGVTGEDAPMYPGDYDEENGENTLNVDYAIKYWIKKGAPASKLNLGMGLYGRSFTLQNPSDNGIGATSSGPGDGGPYTDEAGDLGYNEICLTLNSSTVVWNDKQEVPYAYKGTQWVGYDNVKSITIKSQYVLDNNIGGAMVWSIDTDDYRGKCNEGKYPLLNAIKSTLNGGAGPTTNNPDGTTQTSNKPTQSPTTETTTTTTALPPPPNGVCTKDGYVRDPNNCKVFYYCQNVNGQYEIDTFTCADGTAFDPSIDACNYENLVKC